MVAAVTNSNSRFHNYINVSKVFNMISTTFSDHDVGGQQLSESGENIFFKSSEER